MLGNGLNFLISLIFLFFLFSVLISAAMEAISSVLKLRGQALKVALQLMLDDEKGRMPDKRFGGFGVMDWVRGLFGEGVTESPLFQKVFQGSLVGGLRPKDKPSYIAPHDFAISLLAAIAEDKPAADLAALRAKVAAATWKDTRFGKTMAALLADAGDDYEKLKAGVGGWFDSSMMRLSGEYKRFTQLVTFLIALLLAGALNVDAIRFGERLLQDPDYAKSTADAASDYVKGTGDRAMAEVARCAALPAEKRAADAACAKAVAQTEAKAIVTARLQAIHDANSEFAKTFPFIGRKPLPDAPKADFITRTKQIICYYLPTSVSELLGWLIMAMAAVMGAPFWFDLLQRFVNLRGTGPKPDDRKPGDGGNTPAAR